MTGEPEVFNDTLDLPGLARQAARSARPPAVRPPITAAALDPVATVLVDVPLAHLDRPFDYMVPQTMAEAAVPGARVKVRFAGKDVDGFIVARSPESGHEGRLHPLRRVVSPEPVLTPQIAQLSEEIARRWAGTRSDVLRLAIPPRHATTEKQPAAASRQGPWPALDTQGWDAYRAGLLADLAGGGTVRAVWSAMPGEDWPQRLAEAALATAAGGRGAVVCLPDGRDVDRLSARLTALAGADSHAVLRAGSGPAERYRSFLSLSRGSVPIAIGTRAAAFAPVRDLGLVAIWDDGDDLYAEPRAPYCHAREVLLLRARHTGASALVAGFARSLESHYLLRTGWAEELHAPRQALRHAARVAITGESDRELDRDPLARVSRLPSQAHRLIAEAAAQGPVLVQSPRSGYALRLACDRCREPAVCATCRGPLRITSPTTAPACAWCGTEARGWSCAECGGRGLRAPIVGDRRTAEEFARAFPGVAVKTSSAGKVVEHVSSAPGIVVATPGAEPVAEGGYWAVVLLDTWLPLGRDDFRAEEEALRRWCNAAALVRSAADGGRVLAVGDPGEPTLQALVRWDVGGFAERLIAQRLSAHLPPASRLATLTAPPDVLADLHLDLPPGGEILGPVPADEGNQRLVIRAPRASGPALSALLSSVQQQRSARKLPHIRVQVDPIRIT